MDSCSPSLAHKGLSRFSVASKGGEGTNEAHCGYPGSCMPIGGGPSHCFFFIGPDVWPPCSTSFNLQADYVDN